MKIFVGSLSEQKIDIAKKVLRGFGDIEVFPVETGSGVTEQPLDEETTIQGAINRARRARSTSIEPAWGLGLEAGLVDVQGTFNLLCIAALARDDGNVAIGKSGLSPLPKEVSERVRRGGEFGKEIRDYFEARRDAMTDGERDLALELINRSQSFSKAIAQSAKADSRKIE
ncbi:MAG: DUF84 family protein [Candidatus Taylorbacteria bacterium]|nr:DUF84 family protein [Candidatus Taylorbacteria bacterium]